MYGTAPCRTSELKHYNNPITVPLQHDAVFLHDLQIHVLLNQIFSMRTNNSFFLELISSFLVINYKKSSNVVSKAVKVNLLGIFFFFGLIVWQFYNFTKGVQLIFYSMNPEEMHHCFHKNIKQHKSFQH